jgi:uncharacterized tellurite resistance protein B-like protein
MKNKDFKKVLFKGAFSVMACDGEIAEIEVAEMKEILSNSPYFDGLDYDAEMKAAFDDIKSNGTKSIENFFTLLKSSELSEKQEYQLVEVLARMVAADGKVEGSELFFMHNIKASLKQLTDEKIIISFPLHIDMLLDLGRFESHELRQDLENINFGALGDLNVGE